ncbi:phosphatidylinositol kinase- protein kinase tor1 [Coemansia guatemalensis]|uniref:Serine/threonine-protein kinase TOR n=1 Tax=Coemansia guatemalensis TaxID=2761395 RepID=A0A9W8HZT2_9FUNG|nr:phosphatidylinositol kinase- protein kinase tor1 [Coemansia guatemalensis]
MIVEEAETSDSHGEENSLYDELNTRVVKMISQASDVQDRLGATAILSALVEVDTLEGKRKFRIIQQTKTLLAGTDMAVSSAAVAVYKKQLQKRWPAVMAAVETELNRALEWLGGDRNEVRRMTALRMIEVLCGEGMTTLYAQVPRLFTALSQALRDGRAEMRVAAGRALGASIELLPMSERNNRNAWLNFLYEEQQRAQQTGGAEGQHSALLLSQALVEHGNMHMQNHFGTTCETALRLKDHRDAAVRGAAVELLPMLARFSPAEFARAGAGGESALGRASSFLIGQTRGGEPERAAAFRALGQIAQSCKADYRPFLEATARAIRDALAQRAVSRTGTSAQATGGTHAVDETVAAVLQTVATLATAMGPAMTRYMREILDPMFATGLSTELCDALAVLEREVGQLQSAIQARLLDMVSGILTGAPFRPRQSSVEELEGRLGVASAEQWTGGREVCVPSARDRYLMDAYDMHHQDARDLGADPRVLALRTLRSFDFRGESLSEFVRSGVLPYVGHSNAAVRVEAMQAAAHVVLADPLYRAMAGAGVEVAAAVVQRLVTAAVVDEDAGVRLTAVRMLERGAALDFHVGSAQNIRDLFLLVNDETFAVRQAVLAVVGRLATMNPAHVMPRLRRMVVQLLTELEYARGAREREESMQLVLVLVRAAGHWVRPYVGDIFATVQPRLDTAPPQLAARLLRTVAALAHVGGGDLAAHYDGLLSSLLRALGDGSSADKRLAALQALGSCASFCGMVIDPYTEHPQLFGLLAGILRGHVDATTRQEVMRTIGALGAIDPHTFAAASEPSRASRAAVEANGGAEGDAAGDGAGDARRRRRQRRRRHARPQPNVMTVFNNEQAPDKMIGDIPTNAYGAAFSSDAYYTAVSVNALVQILYDPADGGAHQEATQALIYMFAPQKNACAPFLKRVLEAILHALDVAPSGGHVFYVLNLTRLVEIARELIRPFLSPLFGLFEGGADASARHQEALVGLVEELGRALSGDFGANIATVLPFLVAVVDGDASELRQPTLRALSALQQLAPSLEGHLFLVMPRLVALVDASAQPAAVVRAALTCVAAVVAAVDCGGFASRIVLALTRLLRHSPAPVLHAAAGDVLCTLMEQLQDAFTPFMPAVDAALRQSGATHARYERSARLLFGGRLVPADTARAVVPASGDAAVAGPTGAATQDVDVAALRRAWTAGQLASADGWVRWLRAFTNELLQQSPSPALRACANLANKHHSLSAQLFNAAFVSCWAVLPGQYQQEIIGALQGAAAHEDVPPEVLQTILGLAGFMERDEKQIPIDLKLLGEYADRCHALAKELHYKEAEWALEKNYDTITKLIELNQSLDLHDSATGLLEYVRREQPDIRESVEWYMRLQRWDKALAIYRRQEAQLGPSTPNSVGQIRCLFELSDWDALAPMFDRIWSADGDQELQMASSSIGMSMAWAMGDLERMEFFLAALPNQSHDRAFCRALLAVHRGNASEAERYIAEARSEIEPNLTAYISESYSRGYSQVFRCQLLTELEEAMAFKAAHDDNERRAAIVSTWRQRLAGIQQDVGMWQRLLHLRSMVLRPSLDLDTWIKYVNMARKAGQMRIARDAIAQLLHDEALYLHDVARGDVDNVSPRLVAQAHEYSRAKTRLARQCQGQPQQLLLLDSVCDMSPATQPTSAWESRMRRFGWIGPSAAPTSNAPLDLAIRLSQQPALVYMYLKYKWASGERHDAFMMLEMFSNDYAARIGFDVRNADAFADHIDARVLASANAHSDVIDDAKTIHLLARFYFKQAEWLSSVQQSVRLAHQAHDKAGLAAAAPGDTPYARRATIRRESIGLRRGRTSLMGGSALRDDVRASDDARRASDDHRRSKQDAQLLYELKGERISESILDAYRAATALDRKWYKAWHSLALRHYLETQHYDNEHSGVTEDVIEHHVIPAIHGFFRAIQLSKSDTMLQDTLRLLTAWFNYSQFESVAQAVQDGFNTVSIRTWLQVIPQILARIHIESESTRRLIRQLLVEVGKFHPHAILFSLYVAARSDHVKRGLAAREVLAKLHDLHAVLVEETEVVSRELIRITLLFPEMWYEALRNASVAYFAYHNAEDMMRCVRPLHKRTRNPETLREYHFAQKYGGNLAAAEELLIQYFAAEPGRRNDALVQQAWDLYSGVYRSVEKMSLRTSSQKDTTMMLKDTAPTLLQCQDMHLAMPGTYDPDREMVYIKSFGHELYVYPSKQHPRRIYIYGSDGNKYTFLLKGREDLRQDERVMQLFGLVNSLLARDNETSRRSMAIERFPVIPLSSNSGLIGFYPNCENINNIIRLYREAHGQPLNLEQRLALQFSPNWDTLTIMEKVESFEYALSNTPGNDLQRAMWYKSVNAEMWLDRRTHYTRSLAVMSIAGYILGLGDRHPSNILIHERTGKVVHIDLGDCFEMAAHRDKYPETVPFRLTRMLIMPMEVSSIEGIFKHTANHTMRVLRANRDSLMAVLEAFVFDPLVSWHFIQDPDEGVPKSKRKQNNASTQQQGQKGQQQSKAAANSTDPAVSRWTMPNAESNLDMAAVGGSKPDPGIGKAGNTFYEIIDGRGWQTGNPKARAIVRRIHDKLVGTDFNPEEQLEVSEQIDKLIQQATSSENLAVLYPGWVPLW